MLSFIVVTYNSEKFIERCLLSIYKNVGDIDFEIIIKDNASKDNTVKIINRFIDKSQNIKLIASNKNNGFAGGNNDAVWVARGEILFFLNADTILEKYDHAGVIKLFDRDPSLSIIQPKIRKMMDPETVESTGHYIDILGNVFIENENALNKIFPSKRIFAATGAGFIMKKEIFDKLGGFDKDYFLLYEETDLCWRNNLLGYKAYYFDNLEIFHFGGGSINEGKQRGETKKSYKPTYYYLQNKFFSGIKNFQELDLLILFIFGNCFLYIGAFIFCLLKLELRRAKSIVEALFWIILGLPRFFKKRIINKKILKYSNKDLMKLDIIARFKFFKWAKKFLVFVLFVILFTYCIKYVSVGIIIY